MVRAAAAKGYDMGDHRAQQISDKHLDEFDLIIAMDSSNHADATRRFGKSIKGKLRLFLRDYAKSTGVIDTPDPYYERNFDRVVELVEAGADGLVEALKRGDEP
jgi:protein-tyrosine phosphatase